ncbi:unnamed protein product [Arabidopsis arenosa]|uniref:Uncharacterized protein n=1 Tax=Arabidopsis arenosa TaxID=38785 RepID=A0A8S2A5G7_ARAAE|nr:unnamed protein product [Arabidopsis arenosa]
MTAAQAAMEQVTQLALLSIGAARRREAPMKTQPLCKRKSILHRKSKATSS